MRSQLVITQRRPYYRAVNLRPLRISAHILHMATWLFHRFAHLSFARAHQLGRILGRLVYFLSRGYANKFNRQWNLVSFHSDEQLKARAQAEAGAMFAEIPKIWTTDDTELMRYVHVTERGQNILTLAKTRATIFLTPHIGSFEVAGRTIGHQLPITVLFKPAKQKWLSDLMIQARAHGQMRTAPANLGGVRALLKALKSGHSVGILPDQVPSHGEGEWAPLFGKMAYTMNLPAKLARLADQTVIVSARRYTEQERKQLKNADPIPIWEFDAQLISQEPTPVIVNQHIESLVQQMPEQYLWGYNRFKRTPTETAPHEH